MTGVRIYDPARTGRIYVHTDPATGRLTPPAPTPAGDGAEIHVSAAR